MSKRQITTLGANLLPCSGAGIAQRRPLPQPTLALALALPALMLAAMPTAAQVAAFPGAVGAGANAKGGRGGMVCQVTNLNDTGAGSLRACLGGGNRTIVFRVGGTINVASQINVNYDNITIAGQTAPGGGIQLRGTSTLTRDVLRFSDQASHIVVRFLRIRRGPGSASGSAPIEGDPLEFRCQDCIGDHLSLYWSTDQLFNTSTGHARGTLQNSILAEALNNSTNPEKPHGMGPLLYRAGPFTLHANLIASNMERGPRINNTGVTDVTNNIIYNYRNLPTTITSNFGAVSVNYLNNYLKVGPNGFSGTYAVSCSTTSNAIGVYAAGNLRDGVANQPVQQAACRKTARYSSASYPMLSAGDAYASVLATSGAFPRDAADARVVAYVKSGGGQIVDDPSQVGGWPTIAGGTPYPDADADGMDDSWELSRALSPTNAADRNADRNNDGYTNLEEFLHERAQSLVN